MSDVLRKLPRFAATIAFVSLLVSVAVTEADSSGDAAANADAERPDFTEEYLANPENVAAGKAIWTAQCRHCHGASAYPGKAPKLKPRKYTADFVFGRVTNGFRKMPAWKGVFTFDERKAIVAYVLSRSFSP